MADSDGSELEAFQSQLFIYGGVRRVNYSLIYVYQCKAKYFFAVQWKVHDN
jgi:hypothetical protein